ncbi:MAG: preprotein translocase subunit SecG [Ruminococcaceae bacterium]|nr:preprotein translocase subunit SecG [Oscillospiraceae bacterium]
MTKAHLELFGGVDVLELILTIVHVVLAVVLIAVVLFQSGAQQGLSGSIAGGAETFFGKNKAKTLDGILAKCTAVVAVLFIATSLALFLMQK